MSSEHYVYVCKHGRTIRQCRCPDPNKIVVASKCIESCPPDDECGAWGGCKLPKGHNMGNPDLPAYHGNNLESVVESVSIENYSVYVRFLDGHNEEYHNVTENVIVDNWLIIGYRNVEVRINLSTVEQVNRVDKSKEINPETVSIPNIKPIPFPGDAARGLMKTVTDALKPEPYAEPQIASVTNTFVDSYGITTHYDDGSAITTSHKDFNNG